MHLVDQAIDQRRPNTVSDQSMRLLSAAERCKAVVADSRCFFRGAIAKQEKRSVDGRATFYRHFVQDCKLGVTFFKSNTIERRREAR